MSTASLVSLQVGPSAEFKAAGTGEWWDRNWVSGFRKSPVTEPVWLAYGGLRGDEQADRIHHGGVDKAACVYPVEHYPHWRPVLALPELAPGTFGENFTTTGLVEETVCLGDIFEIGEAQVQVSQPRQPCWKLARRWRIKSLTAMVEETGRTGFYFRVLRHGWVARGQEFKLQERPFPQFTVAYANRVMHHAKDDYAGARKLVDCPALSASWKDSLWTRVQGLPPHPAAERTAQP